METQEQPRSILSPNTWIGEILVRAKLIARDQLSTALQRQRDRGSGRLGEHLVALGYVSESDLIQQLAKQFGIPVVDPTQIDIPVEVLGLLPPSLVRKHLMLPLTLVGSTLTVTMADPSNYVVINEAKFLTGYDVRVTVASAKAIERVIGRLFDRDNPYSTVLNKIDGTQFEVLREQETVDILELERASEDAPVIALVNAIFADAVKKRASDVHIEPYEKIFRVRFRIDGVLQEIMKPPLKLKSAIVSRIKILADLDVAERRLAQDGRIKLRMGPGRDVDVRVSIVPTFAGEKAVLRILDKASIELDLVKLGFSGEDLEIFRDAFSKPHGMILVTGPTGSGKTTTLYSVLTELNKTTVNISTAEDPIEYNLAGINQVQIHEGIGRSFSYCLRAFLRQDPDVIMVGEIRDFETAEIATKAALT
ncbi:MAG: GspE/PulE family protein, partial [Candidatus Binatia bacterium]